MKALHLPTLIGGHPWHLASGERSLGIDSQVLTRTEHQFGYAYDHCLNIDKKRAWGKVYALAKAFFWARRNFDILHFNFGSSLFHIPSRGLNQAELPLYSSRQKLFVTYQGCDARQKFPTMARTRIAPCHVENCYGGMCNSGKLDEERRRGIAKMAKYVDHIWAVNPDLLHFLPPEKSSFLPYAIAPVYRSKKLRENEKFRILFAPTDNGLKGAHLIRPALNELQLTFPNDVEVVLLPKVSHQEFLDILMGVDLLVDQTLVGWYGGAAVEAMMLGVPVAVYVAESDLHFVPSAMAEELKSSVVNIDPNKIFEQLAVAVSDRKQTQNIGLSGQAYALKWHHPKAVARHALEKYLNSL